MKMLTLFALAFAVSLDSFGVGLTYGLRKLKIPFASLLFIAGCSASSILIAMMFGKMLQRYLSIQVAESLGGLLLIGLGVFALYQMYRSLRNETDVDEKMLINVELKRLGVIIQILRKPTAADIDRSGTVKGGEAVLLGIALSLDAFGAGISAALIGYSPMILAVSVAIMSALFVAIGMRCGFSLSKIRWMKYMAILPGCILILLGIWKV